ncbi:MAG: DUF4159 domain-containing protein [Victivallales bacterium]|nr:DUF4159 domain-containing protein [Victivallales bacterium]
MRIILIAAIVAQFALSCALADENSWFVPLGPPPKAQPRRTSGGESFPPLPLPATPLRRTERKKPPSPPKLIGKIAWGETATFAYADGAKTQISDWNLCPDDAAQILNKTSQTLAMPYSTEAVTLSNFHADPEKTPLLLLSGARTLRLDQAQKNIIRTFVMRGGMILCDSIAGSPYFYDSVKKNMNEIFPEFPIREIPEDHPIYHIAYNIEKVKYARNLDSDKPLLEGIYIGARIGVLISKYGLGPGWDNHDAPALPKALIYDVDSASRIGLNIASYAIGYSRIGLEQAKPELFGEIDQKKPTSEFVFAQIRHQGAWDVHPGAAAVLLRALRSNTAIEVNLRRLPVDLSSDMLSGLTFLYLTGLDTFNPDNSQTDSLRAFIASGGFILVNNGLGLKTFDNSARRLLNSLFPESQLQPIPNNHPVFRNVFNINTAQFSPAAQKLLDNPSSPILEGISVNGELRVIYSPVDLEAGWMGIAPPLALSYSPESAMQLGINIVTYAMTH